MIASPPKLRVVLAVEHDGARPVPTSAELVTAALILTQEDLAEISAVFFGDRAEPPARIFAADTGVAALAIEAPSHEGDGRATWLCALAETIRQRNATHLCFVYSALGLDLAPALAAQLGGACLTGVNAIALMNGEVAYRRSLYGGKLHGWSVAMAPLTVLTIEPGAFARMEFSPAAAGPVETRTARAVSSPMRRLGLRRTPAVDAGLAEAEVVVAAGRGMGRRENLDLIRRFAALFSKAAVAGSRAIVDEGWLETCRQVGQTGATVAPKVYLACGISGSAQHLAGMRESGFIVAVNHDPAAPIFQIADVGIVDDLLEFLPAVIAASENDTKPER